MRCGWRGVGCVGRGGEVWGVGKVQIFLNIALGVKKSVQRVMLKVFTRFCPLNMNFVRARKSKIVQ